MKTVILAGGFGTRLSEETELKPKPMVEIGGQPILWHIMKTYSHYGFDDFIICLGYKGWLIKEFFHHYYLHLTDITIDLQTNKIDYHITKAEPWKITLIDTGLNAMTGARIKRIQKYIGDEPFMLTYGDGVSDINLHELLEFHKNHGKAITMTAIQPEGKFGSLDIDNDSRIDNFVEKPKGDGGWINGGFFVCEPKVFDYIDNSEDAIFERSPLENLAKDKELFAYKHYGFWRCMDSLRDKIVLEDLIKTDKAKWQVWK